VLAIPADLQDQQAAVALVDQVLADAGRLDILVNNAGTTWGAPARSIRSTPGTRSST